MLHEIIKLSPEHFPVGTIFNVENGLFYKTRYTYMTNCADNESDFYIVVNSCRRNGDFITFHSREVLGIVAAPNVRKSSLYETELMLTDFQSNLKADYYQKLCHISGTTTSTKKEYKRFDIATIVLTAVQHLRLPLKDNVNWDKLYELVEKQTFVKKCDSHSEYEYRFLYIANKKRLNRFVKQNFNRCLNRLPNTTMLGVKMSNED